MGQTRNLNHCQLGTGCQNVGARIYGAIEIFRQAGHRNDSGEKIFPSNASPRWRDST
jgi:hypothetical protein